MAKIPPLTNIPDDLKGYEYDKRWSERGQKIASRMASFILESIAIRAPKRILIPRVLAYPAVVTPSGKRWLPMTDCSAVYYWDSEFIAVKIPPAKPVVEVREYPYLEDSPVIGKLSTTRLGALKADLAHEMAHWMVKRVLRKPKAADHGNVWRVAYALLRERFVN